MQRVGEGPANVVVVDAPCSVLLTMLSGARTSDRQPQHVMGTATLLHDSSAPQPEPGELYHQLTRTAHCPSWSSQVRAAMRSAVSVT